MACWCVHVEVPQELVSLVEAAFESLGVESLSSFEIDDETAPHGLEIAPFWTIDAYFQKKPAVNTVDLLLKDADVYERCLVTKVPQVDWRSECYASFQPHRIGPFLIHGHHADLAMCTRAPHTIEIEAATAFGTGEHGTTKGCLIALSQLKHHLKPRSILDMGCGSGILGIAAAKLYRAPVLACDIDPEAVRVATYFTRVNGIQDTMRVRKASSHGMRVISEAAPFDLIIANILAKPLCQMAAQMYGALSAQGVVILSGLTQNQETRVLAAYRLNGMLFVHRLRIGEWSTLVLSKVPLGLNF